MSDVSDILDDSDVNRIQNHPGVGGNHLDVLRAGKALRQGRRDFPAIDDLIERAFSELESDKTELSLSDNEYLLPGGPLGNLVAGRRLLGKGRAVIDTRVDCCSYYKLTAAYGTSRPPLSSQ